DPRNPRSTRESEGDQMRGGVRAGGVDHVHRIAAHDAPAGCYRPWPPADPPVGSGQDRRVPASHGEMTLHLDEGRTHHTDIGGNLCLELGIHSVIGTAIEGQDGDAPAELPEIARVFQGPQHTAAAALRRVMIRDEERVPHEGCQKRQCARISLGRSSRRLSCFLSFLKRPWRIGSMQWSKVSMLTLVGLAFLLTWVRPALSDDPVP